MNALVNRDEREQAVDLAADRLSFLVLAYGALLIAAYRSSSSTRAPGTCLAWWLSAAPRAWSIGSAAASHRSGGR